MVKSKRRNLWEIPLVLFVLFIFFLLIFFGLQYFSHLKGYISGKVTNIGGYGSGYGGSASGYGYIGNILGYGSMGNLSGYGIINYGSGYGYVGYQTGYGYSLTGYGYGVNCIDSGKNSNKTFLSGNISYLGRTFTDWCVNGSEVFKFACQNDQVSFRIYPCQFGCIGGKCLSEATDLEQAHISIATSNNIYVTGEHISLTV